MKLDVDKINEKSPYFVNSIGDSYVSSVMFGDEAVA